MENLLLQVENLKKYFPVKGGIFRKTVGEVKAVDGVNFTIPSGKTLGLVGESGCGKTTVGRLILALFPPTSGKIYFRGKDISSLSKNELRSSRRSMQVIFQDPYSSLNPRMTVGSMLGEILRVHGIKNGKKERIWELFELVGLAPEHHNRYSHEFSGGQRQRIGIARALAISPQFIVCDEPVSALDVSIQAQIINLLKELQEKFKLTYLFIAHDLAVVHHISHAVAVMYLGKIVELAKKEELFQNPSHPYTRALLSSAPIPDPTLKRERIMLEGDVPSPLNPPPGCAFHPRCFIRKSDCDKFTPELKEKSTGHLVACPYVQSLTSANF